MPDKRKRTRVQTAIEASVECGVLDKYRVTVRNISLKGVLCDHEPGMTGKRDCDFVLHLTDTLQVRIEARIIRNDAEGLALDFVGMDEEAFFHLRNLVRYHADDPDAIDRELGTPAFT
ncbi:PilZ domain-containing protein [Fundidesulfovibrio agrisoli]|uniref:PilZ domain-containing protein n=1 Tax=Fundidesulfovibrio agrisoli TaxID=2922717 RepID=UPI001FAB4952|nr:PilZ domain-containing protein [Fundidesulfovibrio agrisoli]